MGDPTHPQGGCALAGGVSPMRMGSYKGGVGSPMKMGSYRDGADGIAAISRA